MNEAEMLNEKTTPSFEELLVTIAYCSYIFFAVMDYSEYSSYFPDLLKLVGKICFALIIFKEVLSIIARPRVDFIVITSYVVCAYLFLISQRNGYGLNVSMAFMFALACRDIDATDMIKLGVKIVTVAVVFVILSSLLGIVENRRILQHGRNRQYLGFNYALVPSTFWLNVLLGSFYLQKDKISWKRIIVYSAVTIYLYIATDSRMSFYCSVILIGIIIFSKVKTDFVDLVKYASPVMVISFILGLGLTLFLIHRYEVDPGGMAAFDEDVGNRVSLAYKAFKSQGVTWLGKDFIMIGNGGSTGSVSSNVYNYVDNLYAQMLVKLGIIATGLITIAFTKAMNKCRERNDWYMFVLLFFVAMNALMDDHMICVEANFAIPFLGQLLINVDSEYDEMIPINKEIEI